MSLTIEERQRFERDGFVGPFTYLEPEAAAAQRELVEREIRERRGPAPRDPFESRHQDCPAVYAICAARAIVGRVASVLGPDVVLWNSVLFCKEPGGREIPWHQDLDFLLLEPHVNVSVWIALDRATAKNGCLQVIPGSHAQQVPHVYRQKRHQFMAHAKPEYVDKAAAVDIELEPGQFILFHRDLLHHSGPNLSLDRRLALTARYTLPTVRVNVEGLFAGHRVYRVSSGDPVGVDPHGEPTCP